MSAWLQHNKHCMYWSTFYNITSKFSLYVVYIDHLPRNTATSLLQFIVRLIRTVDSLASSTATGHTQTELTLELFLWTMAWLLVRILWWGGLIVWLVGYRLICGTLLFSSNPQPTWNKMDVDWKFNWKSSKYY